MDNSRSVVPGILPLNRILHNRFAQIALHIALSYALIDCVGERAALNMHILSYLHKYNSHSGILAYRNHICACNLKILPKLTQNLFSKCGGFLIGSLLKYPLHIRREKMVRLYAHFFDVICYNFSTNISHRYSPDFYSAMITFFL